MIDRTHELSVVRQCQILELARSTAYYTPKPTSAEDVVLMRRMDELHLEYPFAGSRMLRDLLRNEGQPVGRKRIRRLMKRMDIEALYRRPTTSRRHPAHPIYPYLLRRLSIQRPNHVWATDITYIPMRRGFIYLVAIVDWYSRRVLAWRLSNTLTTDFCIEALQEAIARYGTPEIFNTDQGSQFTSSEFTGQLKANGIRISMDGKGCWPGQRLRRAPLADHQVRRGVSQSLRVGFSRQGEPGAVHHLLQQPATASGICRQDAGHDLLRRPAEGKPRSMKSALPTAPAVYGLDEPSTPAAVDNATPAGLHLSPGKICPNKRGRLSQRMSKQMPRVESYKRTFNDCHKDFHEVIPRSLMLYFNIRRAPRKPLIFTSSAS